MQLAQFGLCAVHGVFVLAKGCYPRWLACCYLFVMANMLVLFRGFYRQTYTKAQKAQTAQADIDNKATAAAADAVGTAGTTYASSKNKIKNKSNTTKNKSASASSSTATRTIPLSEVKRHDTPQDCWCAMHGNVYDITPFLSRHPGGWAIHLAGGRDATVLFETYHPRGVSRHVTDKYLIGTLPPSDAESSYYSWTKEEGFYPTLRRRVVARLKSLNRPRRGGMEIWVKAFGLLCAFWMSLVAMVTTSSFATAVAYAVFLGAVASFIGTCIQHDGSHGAFATSPFVNKAAGWTLDMIGASAMTWEIQHMLGHHPYTNLLDVDGEKQKKNEDDPLLSSQESDPDVFSSFPVMRMHPDHERSWYHRFQHLYAPLLFAMMTVAKVRINRL